MRRLGLVLAWLAFAAGSQVAVWWMAVLLARSPALARFRDVGPGSLGDAVLLLAIVLAADSVLIGALALARRRRFRDRTAPARGGTNPPQR